ncbi:MAG: PRC-barrel domain-containing protein [Ilumatobacter sp.]|uniref:PRC-barrel domain-containing protein n=1 Tax=Ilumatobacter sp. TaxID=1967498 RepID=UPI00391D1143
MTERLNLMRARDISGLPVVPIDAGDDAAEIKDIVFDIDDHRLVGFTLNQRGWFRGTLSATLPVDNVVGIGTHAVMVPDEDCLVDRGASDEALSRSASGIDVIGDRVFSSAGTEIGSVVDVIIETGPSPKAVGYEVETSDGTVFIPSSAQMSISDDNLVVPAEADDFTRNDLAGFGAAVSSFRDLLDRGEHRS